MRKFPEEIATKQDVENIINYHPEYHKQLKEVLQRAYDELDEADQVISNDIDPNTGEMVNVKTKKVKKEKMKFKDIGFQNKIALKEVIVRLSMKNIRGEKLPGR